MKDEIRSIQVQFYSEFNDSGVTGVGADCIDFTDCADGFFFSIWRETLDEMLDALRGYLDGTVEAK